MNLFEVIILDGILLSFPFIVWILYQLYIKILSKEKKNLLFDVTLFTSNYLVLKYGILNYEYLPFLILNIPIIIAYYKKRDVSAIILSIINCFYFNNLYNFNLVYLFIANIIYFIVYIIMQRDEKFVKIFVIWKMIISLIIITLVFHHVTNFVTGIKVLLIIFSFYIILNLILYLFKQEEKIVALHLKMNEVDKDKKITESLFKITHEIKNPIAVCKGYLDMFDVDNIEHSRKYVPILKNEIKKTLVLLEDFLSINRVKINKELIDINYLLEDVISNFKPILESDHIKCTFLESDDEVYMNADYNRINQVIVNVIKNSMEAVQNIENALIKISTEKNSKYYKILIEDNGEGISKENIDKMNQPFFTTKRNGTGLGVYLSREIVKLHGGTMLYKSKPNIGTKVIITLPLN